MNIGALAGGIAQGGIHGFQVANQAADRAQARELQARQLGIMEEGAKLDHTLKRNELDRQTRELKAHQDALALIGQATGQQADPNTPADQQVVQGLFGGNAMQNPELLNKVAGVYLAAGVPDGTKWLEHAWRAKRENVLGMTDALRRGDEAAALQAFNASGTRKAKAIERVVGQDGSGSNRFRAVFEDGTSTDFDPDQVDRSVFSFGEYRNMQNESRKAVREDQKAASEINKNNAAARYTGGLIDAKSTENAADRDLEWRIANLRERGLNSRSKKDDAGDGLSGSWYSEAAKHSARRPKIGADGRPVVNMQTGEPEMESDPERMRFGMDLIRLNEKTLKGTKVSQEEAMRAFDDFSNGLDAPAEEYYSNLERSGRLVIARDPKTKMPKSVVGIIGMDQEGDPIPVRLPARLQDKILGVVHKEWGLNDAEMRKQYRNEDARLKGRSVPAKPPAKRPAQRGITEG